MLSDLRGNLKVFQEDYTTQLTEEERVSLCEIMGAVDRLEREFHEKRRKQARREVENLLCRDKVLIDEVLFTLKECGVTVVDASQCKAPVLQIQDRRWWEFWE